MKDGKSMILRIFRTLSVSLAMLTTVGTSTAVSADGLKEFFFGERDKDVTRNLAFQGFHRISIEGIYELEVRVGGDFSVQVTGPKDELDEARVSVEEETLVFDQNHADPAASDHKGLGSLFRLHRQGLSVKITMPRLTTLKISGVGNVDVSGIASGLITIDISGIGNVELAGTCVLLKARISGIGNLDAEDLRCKIAEAQVSGIGDASFYASKVAMVNASGIGGTSVHGSPALLSGHADMFSDISEE